jgi:hypothetical protein
MDDRRSFRQRCRQPVPYKIPQFAKLGCGIHLTEIFKSGETGKIVTTAPSRSIVTSSQTPCPICTGENHECRTNKIEIPVREALD